MTLRYVYPHSGWIMMAIACPFASSSGSTATMSGAFPELPPAGSLLLRTPQTLDGSLAGEVVRFNRPQCGRVLRRTDFVFQGSHLIAQPDARREQRVSFDGEVIAFERDGIARMPGLIPLMQRGIRRPARLEELRLQVAGFALQGGDPVNERTHPAIANRLQLARWNHNWWQDLIGRPRWNGTVGIMIGNQDII